MPFRESRETHKNTVWAKLTVTEVSETVHVTVCLSVAVGVGSLHDRREAAVTSDHISARMKRCNNDIVSHQCENEEVQK
jgi:hypothetical protein